MPYRFTMLFNFAASGWSESWYYNGTPTFPPAQNSIFDQVMAARTELCGDNISPQGWRLSDVDNPRQTFTRDIAKINNAGILPDTPSSAWLCIARGANRIGRRQVWLRSIPDAWIAWDSSTQKFLPTGTLVSARDVYFNLLKQGQFCIRTIQGFKPSTTKVRITAIAPEPTGGTTLTVNVAGIDLNKPIIVSGFRKPLGVLNGVYDAFSGFVGGTTFITLTHVAVPTSQTAAYPGGGFVRQQVFGYQTIESMELRYPRKRKVGRAFFADHGRQSRR